MSYYKKKQEELELSRKFTRERIDSDGVTHIWKYNLDKFKNGPYEVEIVYPKAFLTPSEKIAKDNKNLPKSQQKFLNPDNGKMVGYYRAKTLGII